MSGAADILITLQDDNYIHCNMTIVYPKHFCVILISSIKIFLIATGYYHIWIYTCNLLIDFCSIESLERSMQWATVTVFIYIVGQLIHKVMIYAIL